MYYFKSLFVIIKQIDLLHLCIKILIFGQTDRTVMFVPLMMGATIALKIRSLVADPPISKLTVFEPIATVDKVMKETSRTT